MCIDCDEDVLASELGEATFRFEFVGIHFAQFEQFLVFELSVEIIQYVVTFIGIVMAPPASAFIL